MRLKRDEIQREQRSQNHDSFNVPTSGFARDRWLALLPQSSYVGSRSSRVTANQVARSHRSSQVGTLWQMRALVSGSEKAAVATGSWSAPGAVLRFFGEQSKRPLRVDALDCREADVMRSEDVVDLNHFLAHAHFGNPEANQREICEQRRGGCTCHRNGRTLTDQGEYPGQQQDCNAHAGEQPGESGSEDLHVTTLTRAKEVCIG